MRQIYRSFIGVCIAAISLCFSGFGYTYERPDAVSALSYFVGDIGAESAKFKAEQAYMASDGHSRTVSSNGLTRESNGFRLTSMTVSGVAGGKSGSNAYATTV